MATRKLTPKQSAFVLAYMELGNASEAYRQAYDTSKMLPTTVNRTAYDMLNNPKIAARIRKLQAAQVERTFVTIDSLTDEFEEARNLAMVHIKPNAAVSATAGKAKLHGYMIDTHKHTGFDGGPIVSENTNINLDLDVELGRRLLHVLEKLKRGLTPPMKTVNQESSANAAR